MKFTSLFAFTLLLSFSALAQEDEGERFIFGQQPDSSFSLVREAPVSIDLEKEEELAEEEEEPKKKKRKKKVYYGIKTKKGFTRSGQGNKITIELFYYLKEPVDVNPYVPEVYWYDLKQRRVRGTRTFDPRKGVLLHGPYKRIQGEQVIEEGIFFKGVKHGRWTRYTLDDVLVDKRKFYKGWPKESIVKFYDDERTKLKEVTPMVYGQKEGDYYFFHENGDIAIKGEYKEGIKVGRWTEYYPFRSRKKKEIQYPSDPYDKKFEPFINREWNRRGQLVYTKPI